ncbi:MAG: HDIG domain-containing protein [Candidatus Omnitrophica bacterium]|nr:HDIG domain-containing protein [Candidatus Omnitrophota bacterium]
MFTKKGNLVKLRRRVLLGLMALGVGLSAVLVLSLGEASLRGSLQEGDIALRSIYAPFNFSYASEKIDAAATDRLRARAANGILPVYEMNLKQANLEMEKLQAFLEVIVGVQKGEKSKEEAVLVAQDLFGEELRAEMLDKLLDSNPERIEKLARILDSTVFSLNLSGLMALSERDRLLENRVSQIMIRDDEELVEQAKDVSLLLSPEEVLARIPAFLLDEFPEDRRFRETAVILANRLVVQTLVPREDITGERKQAAMDAVEPVYQRVEVRRGQLVVSRGRRIARDHIMQLDEIARLQVRSNRALHATGMIILVSLFVILFFLCVDLIRRTKRETPIKYYSLLGTIILLSVVLYKGIVLSPLPSYCMPVALASILVVLLVNTEVAIVVTVILSLLAGLISGMNLNVALVTFLGGVFAAYFARNARRRAQILQAGFAAAVVQFLCIVAIGLINELSVSVFVQEGFWGFGNGMVSAILVTGLLPLFEWGFKIITNISLIEWSDLNHPLMKEMAVKAPGTYHHSMTVGNLCEAATEAIGGNALLARVGAYFHDIGKIDKAEYFTENQVNLEDKEIHEKLTPAMSRLIIINHVKNGLECARKHNLPQAIADFIPGHHGTSLVFYFYVRALEKTPQDEELEEESFRYPGPKPQTRETAVSLLADSVEAACRSMENPTPERIKELVRKIINNKFIDGQLDECELTLRDLERIADAFLRILVGMHHSRVKYPPDDRGRPVEGSKEGPNAEGQSPVLPKKQAKKNPS